MRSQRTARNAPKPLSSFKNPRSVAKGDDKMTELVVPILLRNRRLMIFYLKLLGIKRSATQPLLDEWTRRAAICDSLSSPVWIAMVGKYTGLSDAYLSVLKALLHAFVACRKKLVVDWVPSADLEEATYLKLLCRELGREVDQLKLRLYATLQN